MEIIPEGKNFRLVPDHELPAIMTALEQYMPEALKFHQTIQTYLNDRIWQFYFYVSKNWPEEPVCLHFPGCTLKPPSTNTVYSSFGVFCPSAHIECVDLLDTEDVLIDWREPMYLNFTHIAIMNRLDAFYERNYGVMERLDGDIYVCAGLPADLELECLPSDEVEMRTLTADNVQTIHDLYPASEIESVEVFERLVNKLPGYGVFTLDGELAAWMMHSYYGAMFSMQTKSEYRRKGYGIHLAQALTKKVLERGYRPFVVIRPGNDASRNLYTKLGFAKAFETCRVTLNPTKLGLPHGRMLVLQPHLLRAAELAEVTAAQERAQQVAAAQEPERDGLDGGLVAGLAALGVAAAGALAAAVGAVDANGDEGIEDGRNEDTISLRRQARSPVNDDERDEGIDDEDDDITQNDDANAAVVAVADNNNEADGGGDNGDDDGGDGGGGGEDNGD